MRRVIKDPDRIEHVPKINALVPGVGIEPTQSQGSRDFKSLASTSSATQAQSALYERNCAAYIIFSLRCQGFDVSLSGPEKHISILFLEACPGFMISIRVLEG